MGTVIDTMRTIGDNTLAKYWNGGCQLYIVRIDKKGARREMVFRAECTEMKELLPESLSV